MENKVQNVWESDLVKNYQSLFNRFNKVIDKVTFLINLYSEYRENHSFGEYDYMVVIDELTEKERIELSEFLDIEFNKLKDELNQIDENKIANRIKTKSLLRTSYFWQTNPDKELPELYKLMKDTYKLIDPQTNLEQFTAVFTGQDIENINPIKWISAKNLNAYLIDQLICKRKLSMNVNKDIWEISKSCFSNGSNFGQLIDNYKNNKSGKPKNHKLIDDLLNTLDTLP